MHIIKTWIPAIIGLALATGIGTSAATPPEAVHYQGVLRDAAGNPLSGSYDILFSFWDAELAGNEIAIDSHTAGSSGSVSVTGGVFDVALGSGSFIDGDGAGSYTTISEVFRDFTDVWMEIRVNGEVLSPRVKLSAAPYAHNATNLEGRDAAFFLDTSASPQTKSGDLTVNDLTLTGNNLSFSGGGGLFMAPTYTYLHGEASTDGLYFFAGNSEDDGALRIQGEADFELHSGNGSFTFWNGTVANDRTAQLDAAGNLQIDGDAIVSGNDILFGVGGAEISAIDSGFYLTAGDADTDDLVLFAGNSLDDGGLNILGDGIFELRSGFGAFNFVNGDTGLSTASLDPDGDLQLDGDLTVSGNDLALGSFGSAINAGPANLIVTAGDADADDLLLTAGNSIDDGRISIYGDYLMELRAGNGFFHFVNGATGELTGWIDSTGNLVLDGDVRADGGVVRGAPASNFSVQSLASLHLQADSNARVMVDADNTTTTNLAEWFHDGDYGPTGKLAQLTEAGNFQIAGVLGQNASFDIAESFFASEPLEPGDVVRVDPNRPDGVLKTSGVDDRGVLGVVSERPGVLLGSAPFSAAALRETWGEAVYQRFVDERDDLRTALLAREPDLAARRHAAEDRLEGWILERFCEKHLVPIALAGRVPVKVDATGAPIRPGDPLAPAPRPGMARKAAGTGPVIGTALEGLASGTGKILVFVHRGSPARLESIEREQARLTETIEERTPDPVTGTQTLAGNLQLVLDRDGNEQSRFSIFRDGERRGALGAEVFRVDEAGNVYTKGALRPASMDVAEYFAVSEPVEPGDVLVVDRDSPGRYRRATEADDRAVIGVVATEPGVLLGGEFSRIAAVDPALARELDLARSLNDRERETGLWMQLEARFREFHAAVALTGTVEVKVDAGFGAIEPGDFLVASSTPGHAKRSDDPRAGTVIGKALGALGSGTGKIRALVSPPIQ